MPKRACKATTKAGKPCKAAPLSDQDFCLAHADAETREKTGFVADNGKGGRKPNPRAVDVLRERLEADIDKVLNPLFTAAEATRTYTDSNGDTHELDDHQIRIVAIRELLDRAYGKPKQQTELSGEVTTSQKHDLSNLSDEELELWEKLQRKAAGA